MDINQFKSSVLIHSDKLFRFSLKIVNDPMIAEDVTQEVMIKLWKMREKLTEYKSIEALAFRVAKNLSLDKLKKNRRIVRLDTSYETQGGDNLSQKIENRDTLNWISKIIATLSDSQQMILHLKNTEGLSIIKIADIMNMKENAVSQQLSRARRIIHSEYDKIESFTYDKELKNHNEKTN